MRTYHVKVTAPGFLGIHAIVTVEAHNEAGACAVAERIIHSQLTSYVESAHETKLREAEQELDKLNRSIDNAEQFLDDPGDTIEQCGQTAYDEACRDLAGMKTRRSELYAVIHELYASTHV
jgi:hypothetical protein